MIDFNTTLTPEPPLPAHLHPWGKPPVCSPAPLQAWGKTPVCLPTIDAEMVISVIESVTDTNPRPAKLTWGKFVASCREASIRGALPLEEYLQAEKAVRDRQKDGEAIIAGAYATPHTREQSALASLAMVPLDFDDGHHTVDGLCGVLAGLGLESVVFTSYSHSPDHPKLRAYLLLSEPITGEIGTTLGRIMDFLDDRIGHIDPACRKPGQLFFAPSCPPGGEAFYQCRHISGAALNPVDFPAMPPQDRIKSPGPTGERPGDDYNHRASLHDLLLSVGWSHSHRNHYTRPGKSRGISGSILDAGFYCHTSAPEATPFEHGKVYDAFGMYAALHHGGDTALAARELAKLGYGKQAAPVTGVSSSTSETPERKPVPIKMDELLKKEFKPIRWAVQGLFPEGLAILSGPPKIGKSWMVTDFGIAVSSGGYVFGHFKAEQGEVLVLSLEDNERRLKSRLEKRIHANPGCNMTGFYGLTTWRRLDRGGLDDLDCWLQEHPTCKLVVIDTIQKIKPRAKNTGGNAYEQDYEALGGLQRLALERQCCILLIHHNRKSDSKNEGDPFEGVSGSIGITGTMDTMMMLRRPRGTTGAVLLVTGRDLADAEYGLTFDPLQCGWTVSGSSHEVGLQDGSNTSRILDALKTRSGEWFGVQDVFETLGEKIKWDTVKRELYRLTQKGALKNHQGKFVYVPTVSLVSPVPPDSVTSDTSDKPGDIPCTRIKPTSDTSDTKVSFREAATPGCEVSDKSGDNSCHSHVTHATNSGGSDTGDASDTSDTSDTSILSFSESDFKGVTP